MRTNPRNIRLAIVMDDITFDRYVLNLMVTRTALLGGVVREGPKHVRVKHANNYVSNHAMFIIIQKPKIYYSIMYVAVAALNYVIQQ